MGSRVVMEVGLGRSGVWALAPRDLVERPDVWREANVVTREACLDVWQFGGAVLGYTSSSISVVYSNLTGNSASGVRTRVQPRSVRQQQHSVSHTV